MTLYLEQIPRCHQPYVRRWIWTGLQQSEYIECMTLRSSWHSTLVLPQRSNILQCFRHQMDSRSRYFLVSCNYNRITAYPASCSFVNPNFIICSSFIWPNGLINPCNICAKALSKFCVWRPTMGQPNASQCILPMDFFSKRTALDL